MARTARFSTDALAGVAPDPLGVVNGNLYLRGSGDPYLSSIDIARLADRVKAAGVKRVTGRIMGDETGFDLLRGVPSSAFRLTAETRAVERTGRQPRPDGHGGPLFPGDAALFAARSFATALRARGVSVRATGGAGPTPANAVPLSAWESAPLADLLRLQNRPSDNFMSEMLIKALGARFGGAGSTAAGAAVVRAELAAFGVAPRIVDGSGLSRQDRTSPREVVGMLSGMKDDPAFTGSLPVAGRSGTLMSRMRGTPAQDRCRAKTGTLRDVSALAGYCTTRTGARVAFAFLMNRVAPWLGRDAPGPHGVGAGALLRLSAQQRQQAGLVEHRDPEPLGLLELGAGRRAGHEVVRLLRHRRRHAPAGGEDPLRRLLAREVGQRPGQDQRAAAEHPLARRRALGLEPHERAQLVEQRAHLRIGELVVDQLRDDRADARRLGDLLRARRPAARRPSGTAAPGCGP